MRRRTSLLTRLVATVMAGYWFLPWPELAQTAELRGSGGERQVTNVARASSQEQLPSPAGGQIELIEYRDIPLPEALQLFSQQSGWNVVPSAQAAKLRVTLYLKDVSPDVALQALTQAHGLWYRRDTRSNVIFLYTAEERPANMPDPHRLERLAEEINRTFPDSHVQLSTIGEQIVVRGEAKDVLEAKQILRVVSENAPPPNRERAETSPKVNIRRNTWLPDGSELGLDFDDVTAKTLDQTTSRLSSNVVNLLRIPGEQQVMLRVTVAEVDRSAARSIGLNFSAQSAGGSTVFRSLTGGIAGVNSDGVFAANSPGNLRLNLDNGQILLAINALRNLKLARTLAEPNLTAMNGEQGEFHAGGKFAVPVVSGLNAPGLQGVQYVQFGVQLQFQPFILDRDRVRLVVKATVSARDESQNVTMGSAPGASGTTVPGLDSRHFQTTVELREGQTLAVAGLIQNRFTTESDRVPFFGDLPVIGRLAAFDRLTAAEQELVILITPELVHPLDPCETPPLPGADVFEPGDIEFYLGGHLEGRRTSDYRSPVRTDIHRQERYLHGRDVFIIGPSGYSNSPPGGAKNWGP